MEDQCGTQTILKLTVILNRICEGRFAGAAISDYGLAFAVVVTLVLFPEQRLAAIHLGPGAHDARGDGENDRHDDQGRHDADGDDLGQSEGLSWRRPKTKQKNTSASPTQVLALNNLLQMSGKDLEI